MTTSRTAVAVPFFPAVRFTRGVCILEHGDSAAAFVGIDTDRVLYLLDSKTAFNFLVARHPPRGLKATNVLRYAYTALELSGNITGRSPVTTFADLPAAARDTVRRKIVQLAQVEPLGGGRMWRVTVVTRTRGGYYRPAIWYDELDVLDSGQIAGVRSTLLWLDPEHA